MEWTGDLLRLSLDNSGGGGAAPLPVSSRLLHSHSHSDETISPMERVLPSHSGGVDESTLLAEAEELLATLDAAAFAARTPSLADAHHKKKHGWVGHGCPVSPSDGPPLKRTAFAASSAALLSGSSGEVVDKLRGSSWRDRVKEEANQLRKVATKLEVQLMLMQQQSESTLAIRNKRVQIWQRLAERQFRMRQLAEAENLQLKAMMHEYLRTSDVQQLLSQSPRRQQQLQSADMIMRMPNYLRGPLKEPIMPARDATMASIFEPMLHRLDTGYAEVDAVFRDNGMARVSSLEPKSYMERKTRRLGVACNYIELGDLRTLPFHWKSVGNLSWHCNRAWHLKDKPYMYPCVDRPNDSFAANYRVTHKSFGEDESVDFKLAVRRYVEADRFVIVYTCQSEGEKALAGTGSQDIGWLVINEANTSHDAASMPITTVQSCSHIFTRGAEQVGHAKVNRLVSLMMCAFEEDVKLINQNVDNRLLEEARAGSSSLLTPFVTAAPVHQAPPPQQQARRELADASGDVHMQF